MNNKLVDHTFHKILEGGSSSSLPAQATRSKLAQLQEVGDAISSHRGEEARQSVLQYAEVKRALEQCLSYMENGAGAITELDFTIFYEYAASQLKKAENTIDDELPELGL